MTHLRKMMLEELQHRNYSAITTRNYQCPTGLGFPQPDRKIMATPNLAGPGEHDELHSK